MSSSESPSEKYSWSFFSERSVNGSTATDFAVAVAAGAPVGAPEADRAHQPAALPSHHPPMSTAARAPTASASAGTLLRNLAGTAGIERAARAPLPVRAPVTS